MSGNAKIFRGSATRYDKLAGNLLVTVRLASLRRSLPAYSSAAYAPSALTISSVIFLASPNSIIVFGRKNSSLSTPA